MIENNKIVALLVPIGLGDTLVEYLLATDLSSLGCDLSALDFLKMHTTSSTRSPPISTIPTIIPSIRPSFVPEPDSFFRFLAGGLTAKAPSLLQKENGCC